MKLKNGLRILLLLLNIVLLILFLEISKNIIFAILMTLYTSLISILIVNFKKNAFFVFYLISFGTFLLLKPIAIEMLNYTSEYRVMLSNKEKNITYICLILSIVFLAIGYGFSKIIKKDTTLNNDIIDEKITTFKKVSFNISIIFLILEIIDNIIRLQFIKEVGYTASYLTNIYSNRGLIEPFKSLAYLAPIAYSLFFATCPSKKECRIPFVLLLISGIVQVMAGNRFEIVSIVFFILIYESIRANNENNEKWINKKHIILLIVLSPIIIVLLQYTIYWRDGSVIKVRENVYSDFFYSVGGSSDLIGFGNRYIEELNNHPYSFGNTYRALNDNIISKIIGFSKSYQNQSIDKALNGHSLASSLSYKIYPKKYLAGYGMGDCYIADLYVDYSYIGVIIGNIIIGFTIGFITKINIKNYVHFFVCIFSIVYILRMPRDTFDYLLAQFVGLKNWLFIIAFICIIKIKKRRNKNEKDSYINIGA